MHLLRKLILSQGAQGISRDILCSSVDSDIVQGWGRAVILYIVVLTNREVVSVCPVPNFGDLHSSEWWSFNVPRPPHMGIVHRPWPVRLATGRRAFKRATFNDRYCRHLANVKFNVNGHNRLYGLLQMIQEFFK